MAHCGDRQGLGAAVSLGDWHLLWAGALDPDGKAGTKSCSVPSPSASPGYFGEMQGDRQAWQSSGQVSQTWILK